MGWEPYQAISLDPRELERFSAHQRDAFDAYRNSFYLDANGFFDAAQIACRLAHRNSWRNAAFKFPLSGQLAGVHHMDLRPGAHDAAMFRSSHPMDWIWFSQSIFAAYGVVEELRLTPQASSTKPSLLRDGTWNPEVRTHLECRLAKIGIRPQDTLYWNVRGRPRRLEKKAQRRITSAKPGPWTRGNVRDASILYIDAINTASYLRSNVTAHVGEVSGLTAIDVPNVQQLARLLLLHAVGFQFWRHPKVNGNSTAKTSGSDRTITCAQRVETRANRRGFGRSPHR